MSKKALAALIGVLGVLCVACGVFLLTSRSQPATADPTPQASPTVKPTAVPTASPHGGAGKFPAESHRGALRQPHRLCHPPGGKPGHLRLASDSRHGVRLSPCPAGGGRQFLSHSQQRWGRGPRWSDLHRERLQLCGYGRPGHCGLRPPDDRGHHVR